MMRNAEEIFKQEIHNVRQGILFEMVAIYRDIKDDSSTTNKDKDRFFNAILDYNRHPRTVTLLNYRQFEVLQSNGEYTKLFRALSCIDHQSRMGAFREIQCSAESDFVKNYMAEHPSPKNKIVNAAKIAWVIASIALCCFPQTAFIGGFSFVFSLLSLLCCRPNTHAYEAKIRVRARQLKHESSLCMPENKLKGLLSNETAQDNTEQQTDLASVASVPLLPANDGGEDRTSPLQERTLFATMAYATGVVLDNDIDDDNTAQNIYAAVK